MNVNRTMIELDFYEYLRFRSHISKPSSVPDNQEVLFSFKNEVEVASEDSVEAYIKKKLKE
jgi:hypothetical protein